jgi:hypothetical protein
MLLDMIMNLKEALNGFDDIFSYIDLHYGERPECRPSYMLVESKLLHHVISRKIDRSRIKEKYLRPIKTFND